MRILAIADRPPKESILELKQKYLPNIICCLGDLDYFILKELTQINDIPKLGIYGNHCSGSYFDSLGIKNMHLNTFEFNGFIFGGFEGSHKYKESAYSKMYTQNEAKTLLQNFPYVDIMLSHSPPFGINDEPESLSHQGFIALKTYLDEKMPKYFLHGHTYPTVENMVKKYNQTNIIYVHTDKIIEIS